MFTDSVLFVNAMTFLSINAMITYFLNSLGASTFQIGLANALVSVGSFMSQPYFANKVMNLPFKLHSFIKYLFIQRVFFLVFVMTIPLLATRNPEAMIILFLICWTVFNFFVGCYGPFYMSLFAKMVAVQQRGKLKGFSGGFGNLLALGSAYAAGVILKDVPYPYNYTAIFAAGVLILMADAVVFAVMKEESDQVTPLNMKYFQYFKNIPELIRENKRFKTLVLAFSFILVSQVSLAYYALYAIRVYHIPPSDVAVFTAITGLINIGGSVMVGVLADKYSHRLILLISSLCAAAAGFLVLGVHHIAAVYAAFALTTLCLCGYNLSSGIVIIENVSHEKLPMCISVNALITLIISAVVTLGSSFLIDAFSFGSVFLISAIAGLIGFASLFYGFRKKGVQAPADLSHHA
jgi:predicted MFS family arabinose efflux permease